MRCAKHDETMCSRSETFCPSCEAESRRVERAAGGTGARDLRDAARYITELAALSADSGHATSLRLLATRLTALAAPPSEPHGFYPCDQPDAHICRACGRGVDEHCVAGCVERGEPDHDCPVHGVGRREAMDLKAAALRTAVVMVEVAGTLQAGTAPLFDRYRIGGRLRDAATALRGAALAAPPSEPGMCDVASCQNRALPGDLVCANHRVVPTSGRAAPPSEPHPDPASRRMVASLWSRSAAADFLTECERHVPASELPEYRGAVEALVYGPSEPLAGTRHAYEQAAQWCMERAAKIRARGIERPAAYGGDSEGAASWVEGCAATILYNAEQLAASPTPKTDAQPDEQVAWARLWQGIDNLGRNGVWPDWLHDMGHRVRGYADAVRAASAPPETDGPSDPDVRGIIGDAIAKMLLEEGVTASPAFIGTIQWRVWRALNEGGALRAARPRTEEI